MALRKTVGAKPLDLGNGLLRELARVIALHHAGDQLVLEMRDLAGDLERGHRAPQLIGLARREARADDGDLHRLLLKQRHPECLAEHPFQVRCRKVRLLLTFAPAEVRMIATSMTRS